MTAQPALAPLQVCACVFELVAAADPDALLRLLGPFAVLGANVIAVAAERRGERLHASITVEGLTAERAEHLERRLLQLPAIHAVALLEGRGRTVSTRRSIARTASPERH